jgi:hypothetical protein
LGRFDQAIPQLQEAIRRLPNAASYNNLAFDFLSADRSDEAKAAIDQALAHNFESARVPVYFWAFLVDDEGAMREQVNWAHGKTDMEGLFLDIQSATEAFHGRLRHAAANLFEESPTEPLDMLGIENPRAFIGMN